MYPLVESIQLKDGVIQNVEYHQDRLRRSMNELFPKAAIIDLAKELSAIQIPSAGIFKIRVVYGATVEEIETQAYSYCSIKSFKVVYDNNIDYHLKYTDRQLLNFLYGQKGNCDDIIIVRNGLITDAFSANLLFYDGRQWFTPDSPLLKGTKRQFLLDKGLIAEKQIKIDDLASFHKVGLINAMIDFDNMPSIDTKDIYF